VASETHTSVERVYVLGTSFMTWWKQDVLLDMLEDDNATAMSFHYSVMLLPPTHVNQAGALRFK
jgi:hypothetical protein